MRAPALITGIVSFSILLLCTRAGALEPVVFVPALLGSVLNASLHQALPKKFPCKSSTSESYTLYAAADQISSQLPCFIAHMSLVLDPESGCADFPNGVDVVPMDWGGIDGIRAINPHDPVRWGPLLKLIDELVSAGYRPGHNIRGAPYDFRSWGGPCYTEKILDKLTDLIVDTALINGNVSVTLMCHSMGCPLAHHLLLRASSQWKDAYVTRLISLGGPYAGAPDMIHSVINGPAFPFIPTGLAHRLRASTGTWPSLLSLLPYNAPGIPYPLYNTSDTVLYTPMRNYSVSDMAQLVADIGPAGLYSNLSGGASISPYAHAWWDYVHDEIYNSSGHPGVAVSCMFIDDVDTPYSFRYTTADLSDEGVVVDHVKGDGMVPLESARDPCLQWAARQRDGANVTLHAFHLRGKAGHVTMPSNPDVIDTIKEILGLAS